MVTVKREKGQQIRQEGRKAFFKLILCPINHDGYVRVNFIIKMTVPCSC